MKMDKEDLQTGADDTPLQLVTCEFGGERFGIDILNVEEIMRVVPITKLPGSARGIDVPLYLVEPGGRN